MLRDLAKMMTAEHSEAVAPLLKEQKTAAQLAAAAKVTLL